MKNGIPQALLPSTFKAKTTNPNVCSFAVLLMQRSPTGGAIHATATYTAAPVTWTQQP